MKRWLGRAEQEVVQLHDMEAHGGRLRVRAEELPLGHAADEDLGQFGCGQVLEGGAEVVGGEDAVLLLVEDPVQDERSGRRDLQGLGEQIAEEVDGDTAVAQDVREAVVLRARPAHPEQVVEEERVLVAGVSLLSSRSGRCRMTRRSRPASESTWNPMSPS